MEEDFKEDGINKLNDLIDSLRAGTLSGTLEIKISLDGNSIFVRKKNEEKKGGDPTGSNKTRRIVFPERDLSYLNVKDMDVRGSDFSGLRMRKADFSGSHIEQDDFSGSDLEGTAFSGAFITESSMERAKNINIRGSYLTGSVNLNYAQESEQSYVLHPVMGLEKESMYQTEPRRSFDGNHHRQGRQGGYGSGMGGGHYH